MGVPAVYAAAITVAAATKINRPAGKQPRGCYCCVRQAAALWHSSAAVMAMFQHGALVTSAVERSSKVRQACAALLAGNHTQQWACSFSIAIRYLYGAMCMQ
jgi:hypothetical protein